MKREKGFMPEHVLKAVLARAKTEKATKLVLHHFGEPLLHPQFGAFLKHIGKTGIAAQFSTNGLLLKKAWGKLKAAGTDIFVMLAFHQWIDDPKQYVAEVETFREMARGTQIKVLPAYAFKNGRYAIHSWAEGQEDNWNVEECPFIKYNLAVILWNGDIACCCVDHEGKTVRHNILDDDADLHVSHAWNACASCDVGRLMRGEVY
jgi:hypothetical protein